MALLEGIRVIELGTAIAAPLAAMHLADLGADVIKVERPGGDPFRQFPRMQPSFAAVNRNKRAIVCDLTLPSGREELAELLAEADVFIENLRPGVLERLGFALPLAERWPRLIHCSVTGFGTKGPDRNRPAFDGVIQATSGLTSLLVDVDASEVLPSTIGISDLSGAMYAALAVLSALNERWRTGTGVRMEVNMLEASMAFMGYCFTSMAPGHSFERSQGGAISQSFVLRCADGKLINVHLSSVEKFWVGLLEVIESPELALDERFRVRPSRVEHYLELRRALEERFARLPRAAWVERLLKADIPFGPVQDLREVLADPQVVALETAYELPNDLGEPRIGIQPPILANGQRPIEMRPAPELDEHGDELRRAWMLGPKRG